MESSPKRVTVTKAKFNKSFHSVVVFTFGFPCT